MTELAVWRPTIFRQLDKPKRYKVLYGGRGRGASWYMARAALIDGFEKPMLILCTRELQKSIKDSVHRLLKNQISLLGLDYFYTVTEKSIKGNNGTEFIFLGLKHNAEEIKSTEGIDRVLIEEAHNLTEAGWDVLTPTIRKEDSEIWISFNTRFKFDHVYQLFVATDYYKDQAIVIKSSYRDNKHFPEVLREEMENQKAKDYEKYLHVWEGELKTLTEGAIFGAQITKAKQDGRLLNIPINSVEVDTFWDVGKSDSTAIWFIQRVGMEYRVIDYYENRLEDIEHYIKVLKGEHPEVEGMGYTYGKHYMPHDVEHDRLGMVKNIKDQFIDGGIKPVKVVERIRAKETAIQMARNIFSQCYFHQGDGVSGMKTRDGRMDRGWEVLCNYRYEYKDDRDVFVQSPHHDWASNGSDAFQQFAQSVPRTRTREDDISERRRNSIKRNKSKNRMSHIV